MIVHHSTIERILRRPTGNTPADQAVLQWEWKRAMDIVKSISVKKNAL